MLCCTAVPRYDMLKLGKRLINCICHYMNNVGLPISEQMNELMVCGRFVPGRFVPNSSTYMLSDYLLEAGLMK